MPFKVLDYISIFFSLALTVSVAVWVYAGDAGSSRLRIQSSGGVYVYSLDDDREIAVEGPLGTSYIHIHDGKAAFVESPCANKLCIQAGELEESGDWSACMPNKVFVQIEGGAVESDVDAATY